MNILFKYLKHQLSVVLMERQCADGELWPQQRSTQQTEWLHSERV